MAWVYIAYDKGIISLNIFQKERKKENNYLNESQEKIQPLNLSKCINNNDTIYKNSVEKSGDYGLAIDINWKNTRTTLNIDWNKFGLLSEVSSWSGSIEKYDITGATKKNK